MLEILQLCSPLLAAALDGFVSEDLQNRISDVLALTDLSQSSGAELVRHFLVVILQF